ncbi:hypothetical protein [Shewanella subflava]|uniref:Uncharacterized protein n=1 Tax=Shewanella subflava TaxID=2986476 RepID=A0ABT3IAQ7_9GAMM|nr:hypothetical protein [Shewanella subflava]MCW3173141.1 hypothetical protein [Shewanella subflava]
MKFKAGSNPIENMPFSAFFVWGAEGFQRASFVKKACVLPLWSGVGEAPRPLWPQAIFQTNFLIENIIGYIEVSHPLLCQ